MNFLKASKKKVVLGHEPDLLRNREFLFSANFGSFFYTIERILL
jgi:hypothetical protein